MRTRLIVSCILCVALLAAVAYAAHHETDALIELDKKWGSAVGDQAPATLDEILADDLLAITGNGVQDKAAMIAESTAEDAPTGPYVAGDYKVQFLDDNTAIMVHSTGDPDPHWSLHVWKKKDGKWQVVGSASTPKAE